MNMPIRIIPASVGVLLCGLIALKCDIKVTEAHSSTGSSTSESAAVPHYQHRAGPPSVQAEREQNTLASDCPAAGAAEATAQSWAALGSELWPADAHVMHFEWALWVKARPYLLKVLWNGMGPLGFTFEAMKGQVMRSAPQSQSMYDLDDPHSTPFTSFATQVRKEGLSQSVAWEMVESWLLEKGLPQSGRRPSTFWRDRILIVSPFPVHSVYEARAGSRGWASVVFIEFKGERMVRYVAGPVRCASVYTENTKNVSDFLCTCATNH